MGDPLSDEFDHVSFHRPGEVGSGKQGYNENDHFAVDYRDFPAKVTDVDTSPVVYPAP